MGHKVQKIKVGRMRTPNSRTGSIASRSIRGKSPSGSVSSFGSLASTSSVAVARARAAEEERMRARANACNVKEYKHILDEKEKQVASMLQEREMDRDEIVRVSAQGLELTNQLEDMKNQLEAEKAKKGEKPPKEEDEDDLEDFGDDGPGQQFYLNEIEDLKQQLEDLKEEKIFADDEWQGVLSAQQESNNKLISEIEKLKKQLQDNAENASKSVDSSEVEN